MIYLSLFLCALSFHTVSACATGWNETSTGQCVRVFNNQLNWRDAEDYCIGQGGHLASVRNAFDGALLSEMAASVNCRGYYTGGICSNQHCIWVDQTAFTYTNWQSANFPDKDPYVLIGSVNGWWSTESGSDTECFACEKSSVQEKQDCQEWRKAGETRDGLYEISVGGLTRTVYCDMTTDGGGWTVFQRRVDGTEPFWSRSWQDYKNGFGVSGQPGRNYWAGNELIHQLTTKDSNVSLRIEMHDDGTPNSNFSNTYWWNDYFEFKVSSESDLYRLNVGITWNNVQGNASTGWFDITYSSGAPFSTVDNINDPRMDCVTKYQMGGWWLYNCALSSLNGAYTPLDWSNGYGLFWIVNGDSSVIHPRRTEMKLRAVS